MDLHPVPEPNAPPRVPPLPARIPLTPEEDLRLLAFRLQRALLAAQRDLVAHEAARDRLRICLSYGVPLAAVDAYVYEESARALVLRMAP
jgi:hypothetical protein